MLVNGIVASSPTGVATPVQPDYIIDDAGNRLVDHTGFGIKYVTDIYVQNVDLWLEADEQPAHPNIYQDEVLADNPLRYYSLDDSLKDSGSDGVDLTEVGTPAGTAKSLINTGTSTDLDGATEFLTASPMDTLDFPCTLECWINADTFATGQSEVLVATAAKEDEYRGFALMLSGNGKLLLLIGNGVDAGSNGRKSALADDAIELGVDYHIVAVFNSINEFTLYVNGTEYTLGAFDGAATDVVNAGDSLDIGYSVFPNDPDIYFEGRMGHVAVYDTALSDERIQVHYDAAGISIVDSSPDQVDVQRVGQVAYDTDTYMSAPSSLAFDGLGRYIQVGVALLPATADFTVEGWINKSKPNVSQSLIYSQYDVAPAEGRLNFSINNGVIRLFIGATSGNLDLSGTTIVDNGKWYHVAMVKESNVISLYLNGELEASQTYSVPILQKNLSTVGAVIPVPTGLTIDVTAYGGAIDEFKITADVARYTESFTPESFPDLTPPTDYIAKWNFNEASGTVAVDETGNFNGTYTDASLRGSGFNGTGLVGDGSEYVSLGVGDNLLSLGDEFTTLAWVYWDGSSFTPILSLGKLTSGSILSDIYGYSFIVDAAGKLRAAVRTQTFVGYGGSIDGLALSADTLPMNTWALVSCRRGLSSCKLDIISVAGITSETIDYGGTYSFDGWQSKENWIAGTGFTGTVTAPLETGNKLDSVQIFNREITDTELTNIWNGGRGHVA